MDYYVNDDKGDIDKCQNLTCNIKHVTHSKKIKFNLLFHILCYVFYENITYLF